MRAPACSLRADSDLGERLVTVAVGALPAARVADALDAGLVAAEAMRERGLIEGACLCLAGQFRTTARTAAGDTLRFPSPVTERRLQ